jgi:hypothetical protein
MKTFAIDITDEFIEMIVDSLNTLEFNGRLTVELVKTDDEVFKTIFNAWTISHLLAGFVKDVWSDDTFADLDGLLASRNL